MIFRWHIGTTFSNIFNFFKFLCSDIYIYIYIYIFLEAQLTIALFESKVSLFCLKLLKPIVLTWKKEHDKWDTLWQTLVALLWICLLFRNLVVRLQCIDFWESFVIPRNIEIKTLANISLSNVLQRSLIVII